MAPNLQPLHEYLLKNNGMEGLRDIDKNLPSDLFAKGTCQDAPRRRQLGDDGGAAGQPIDQGTKVVRLAKLRASQAF